MGRKTLAIFLGLVVGSIVNMAFITVSHTVFPLPDGVDPNDMESFRAHVEANGLPTGALLIVLAAHAGGSLASGWVCGLIVKRVWLPAGFALGALWTCGGIYMLTMIPSPMWFAVADLLLYVPAALVGVIVGGKMTSPQSP